jgi:IS5 family transposase
MGQGFGRIEKRRRQLEARKDKLQDLNELVPWAVLRQVLEQLPRKERKSNAGRKAIDPMILFKLLLLKHLYNLSNEEVEYQAHDRASFRRFEYSIFFRFLACSCRRILTLAGAGFG